MFDPNIPNTLETSVATRENPATRAVFHCDEIKAALCLPKEAACGEVVPMLRDSDAALRAEAAQAFCVLHDCPSLSLALSATTKDLPSWEQLLKTILLDEAQPLAARRALMESVCTHLPASDQNLRLDTLAFSPRASSATIIKVAPPYTNVERFCEHLIQVGGSPALLEAARSMLKDHTSPIDPESLSMWRALYNRMTREKTPR